MENKGSTSLADDLIAVRTLLILRGRAVGKLKGEDGRVCLRQAMIMVTGDPITHSWQEETWDAALESYARDCALNRVLVEYLPQDVKAANNREATYCMDGNESILAHFNDRETTTDQDVLDLIDKVLAGMGAL